MCYLEKDSFQPFDLAVGMLYGDIKRLNGETTRKISTGESSDGINIFTSFVERHHKYYVTLKLFECSSPQISTLINECLYYDSQGFNIHGLEGHPDAMLDLKNAELNNTVLIHKKDFNIPIKHAYITVDSIIRAYENNYTQVKMVDYQCEWKPSSFIVEEYRGIVILDDLIKSFIMAGFELRGDAARMLYRGQSLNKMKSREIIDFIMPDFGFSFHKILINLLSIYRVKICQSFLEKDYGINLYCEWRGMALPRIRICTDLPFSQVETSINNSLLWIRDYYNHTYIFPSMFFRGLEESYTVAGNEEVSRLYTKTEGSNIDYRSIHFFKSTSYSSEYKILVIHKMLTRHVDTIKFFDHLMTFTDN